MEIRTVDPADQALVREFWEVGRVADEHERQWSTYWAWETALVYLTTPNQWRELHLLGAFENGRMIGALECSLPVRDNTSSAGFDLYVDPAHRRRGVGTALVEQLIPDLAERDRRVVMVEVNTPIAGAPSAGMGFAERHGFAPALVQEHRVLDLPATEGRWPGLAAEVAPAHADYELVTWFDTVPDEFLEGYCALQHAFNDEAPSGELEIEAEHWDEQRVRGKEERFRRAGRHEVCTVAVAPDGAVVGLTEMIVSDHEPDRAMQCGTLVLPGHRGHRLGLALKVANQTSLRDRFPAVHGVHAWNADVNEHMNAINARLGFTTVERLVEVQREVTS